MLYFLTFKSLNKTTMKKIFTLLFLNFFFFISNCFGQPSFIKDSLDKYVEREMKRWNVPGSAVAVVKDGKVVVMKGYGVRETGKADRVDENTLFQIASNSKAFTGTSIALLDYQKRLSLNDKVTKWLPYFKLKDESATGMVTVRDLLCHRIGFETFQSDLLNWNCNASRKELIVNMRNVDAAYPFRAHYGYCNVAFLAAGEVIPAVTDTSWDDFVKYHFFLPLKMNRSSTMYKNLVSDNNACKPYTLINDKLTLLSYANVDALGPAASINSCIKDLSNWLLMQLDSGRFEGKRVFPYEALRATYSSNTIVADMNPKSGSVFQNYGLGWFLLDYNGKKVIRHDGGADGFVTTTCFVPALNLGIVVLTNTDANSFYSALRKQIIDAYMNLPYQNHSALIYNLSRPDVKKENEEMNKMLTQAAEKPKATYANEEYCGKYNNPVYGNIEITTNPVNKNELVINFSHHPTLKGNLSALGNNDFVCKYSIVTYGIKKINFKDEGGKVKGVVIRVNEFVDLMDYEFVKQVIN